MRFPPERALAACVVVAAALRIAFLLSTRADPVFRIPDLDEAFYHLWARSLAEGRGDFQGPYFVGPLYPYAVALLYRIFGPEPFAVRIVQSLFGVLDVALVFAIGRRVFGATAGVAAAVLLGFYGPLVFYENLLLLETTLLTLALAALYVLLVPRWKPTRRGAAVGALLGLATLARPTVLLLAPVALAALWWVRSSHEGRADAPGEARSVRGARGDGGRAGRALLACATLWVAVLLPVVVRNARLGAVTLTTNGGVNFYAGNSPGATGHFSEPPGIQFFRSPMLVAASPKSSLPPEVARRALTVRAAAGSEVAADSDLWTRRALEWIGHHPLDFVKLELRKLWLLLQAHEVAQIESYAFQRQRLPGLRLFFVDLSWIWPLAALGLWCAWRQRRPAGLVVVGFAVALLLPCILFFVNSRYRLAAVPPLAILGGSGAATLLSWVQSRRKGRTGVAVVALALLALLTRLGHEPVSHDFGWEKVQMADRSYALGDLAAAIRWQEEAARALPERPEVQMSLALYYSERQGSGDLARAETLLRDAARRSPSHAPVWFNLGVVLVRQGRAAEARAAWERALTADPSFEAARARLRALPDPTPQSQPQR